MTINLRSETRNRFGNLAWALTAMALGLLGAWPTGNVLGLRARAMSRVAMEEAPPARRIVGARLDDVLDGI